MKSKSNLKKKLKQSILAFELFLTGLSGVSSSAILPFTPPRNFSEITKEISKYSSLVHEEQTYSQLENRFFEKYTFSEIHEMLSSYYKGEISDRELKSILSIKGGDLKDAVLFAAYVLTLLHFHDFKSSTEKPVPDPFNHLKNVLDPDLHHQTKKVVNQEMYRSSPSSSFFIPGAAAYAEAYKAPAEVLSDHLKKYKEAFGKVSNADMQKILDNGRDAAKELDEIMTTEEARSFIKRNVPAALKLSKNHVIDGITAAAKIYHVPEIFEDFGDNAEFYGLTKMEALILSDLGLTKYIMRGLRMPSKELIMVLQERIYELYHDEAREGPLKSEDGLKFRVSPLSKDLASVYKIPQLRQDGTQGTPIILTFNDGDGDLITLGKRRNINHIIRRGAVLSERSNLPNVNPDGLKSIQQRAVSIAELKINILIENAKSK